MSPKRNAYRSITLATLITEYRTQFPEVAGRTIFVSNTGGNLTDPPDIAAQKTVATLDIFGAVYGTAEKEDLRLHLQNAFTNAKASATYIQPTDTEIIFGLPAKGQKFTDIYDRSLTAGYFAGVATHKRYDRWGNDRNIFDICFIFDHETAHSLTRALQYAKGIDTWRKDEHQNNRFECIADAFAMIRHVQRFGNKTGYPEFLIDLRARHALYDGDALHYTSRAIAEVLKLDNIATLTPQQAIDMAVTIADKTLLRHAEGKELASLSDKIDSEKLAQQMPLDAPLYLAKKIAELKLPMAFECATIEMGNLKALVPSYSADLKAAITEAHDCLLRKAKPDGSFTKLAKKMFMRTDHHTAPSSVPHKAPKINMLKRL